MEYEEHADDRPTLRIEVTDTQGHQVTQEFDIEATVADVQIWAAHELGAGDPHQCELLCGSVPAHPVTPLYDVVGDGDGFISDGEPFELDGQTYDAFTGMRFHLVVKQPAQAEA